MYYTLSGVLQRITFEGYFSCIILHETQTAFNAWKGWGHLSSTFYYYTLVRVNRPELIFHTQYQLEPTQYRWKKFPQPVINCVQAKIMSEFCFYAGVVHNALPQLLLFCFVLRKLKFSMDLNRTVSVVYFSPLRSRLLTPHIFDICDLWLVHLSWNDNVVFYASRFIVIIDGIH